MSPVPVDPFADLLVGAVANPDQLDARFLELYKALDPARNGLDWTNVRTGGLADLVTSLPASPRDGQECHFLADAAAGVIWHLRYRAASPSAFKWECIGGRPLVVSVNTQQTMPAVGSYQDLTTVGPDVTVPLAGDYDVDSFAQAVATVTAVQFETTVFQNGVAGNLLARETKASANATATLAAFDRLLGLSAATLLRLRYMTNGNGTQFTNRRLRVMPGRVG